MSTIEKTIAQEVGERKQLEREAWCRDAHAMIDWLSAKPEILDEVSYGGIQLSTWIFGVGMNDEEKNKSALSQMRKIARRFGKATKEWGDYSFKITKKFGVHGVTAQVERESTCERKVIGTEHVPEYRVAAHEREIVEWECTDPSLLRAAK